MSLDQLISPLVAVTLIEMMFATGLGARLEEIVHAACNGWLLLRSGLANYVAVPAAAVTLILLVDPDPLVAAGILILAMCPGAPYAPPLTALARGTTATSVGLMVILAGSSAIVAPLFVSFLLPLTVGGADLHVDPVGMFVVVMATQLVPLCYGLAINDQRPDLAARWLGPANAASKILNAATLALILASQFSQLLDVRLGQVLGMLILMGVGLGAGWSAGGRWSGDRKAVALTTSIRNVGLGLQIAASAFAGTSAATTVVIYGLMQLFVSFLVALWWRSNPSPAAVRPFDRART
jgi:BASS family bile acid:Na+ symporter